MLRRLSVFAGGWTLEAAEAVCWGTALRHPRSLTSWPSGRQIVGGGGATSRGCPYRLLEMIRQYSWDRLDESGEAAVLRRQHRDWCLELAEQANLMLRGSEQIIWFRRLEADHDNLRAALERSTMDEDGARRDSDWPGP